VSAKRNRDKKGWARRRRARTRAGSARREPAANVSRLRPPPPPIQSGPSELDQVGVLIVEEQLGLAPTDIDGLRAMAARLPFEPSMSVLALLAGKVEESVDDSAKQLEIAEWLFGAGELVQRYRALIAAEPKARIFGPQSLCALMRILIEEAHEAPITDELTAAERLALIEALVAANSVTERGIESAVGANRQDLLAYELQVGNYYSRPPWMGEMARARELYRLATEDSDLMASFDRVPLAEWISSSGLSVEEQGALGFALSASANAWDADEHPHVPAGVVEELLERAGLGGERRESALAVLAVDRATFRRAFTELGASGKRFIWELRPFNTWPFLRLAADNGLLLLGRPWMLNWLSEGFHYRALRVAQADDAAGAHGRHDHVQRYTAYAGQVFETYCLNLAREALREPTLVLGEQRYGKGGGHKTSDIAVFDGRNLILFEANARRVGAEPLLSGDPLDASDELGKLLVKKINQLGVAVGALQDSSAVLPGIEMAAVERIIPVVVSAGRLWQTGNLWDYLDRSRDLEKCKSFGDKRVLPLQALDPAEYEQLLALAYGGASLGDLLARKAAGPYRHRDLAAWLKDERPVANTLVRLPAIEATFATMMSELEPLFGVTDDS
jgi:hypothetical protein